MEGRKKFFLISNYLSLKFKDITVITISNKIKTKLNKNIKIKSYQNDILEKFGRRKNSFYVYSYLLKNYSLTEIISAFISRKCLLYTYLSTFFC